MKSVIVKLQIQFDIFTKGEENDMSAIHETLNNINSALQSANLDCQPQLLCNSVDDSDCEVSNDEEDIEDNE